MSVGRRALTLGLLLPGLFLVVSISCSKSSPTQPAANRVLLTARILPGSDASPSSMAVDSSICSCTTAPLSVSINSRRVGTISCGTTATFAYPDGTENPLQVRVESPEIEPILLTVTMTTAGVPAVPSCTLSLRCPAGS